MLDVSISIGVISAKSAASRKFHMQFLHDYVNAVLNREAQESY